MEQSVYAFPNYREFLSARLSQMKARDKKYSLSFFSKHLGTSETYLKQVVSGRRTLSLEKAKLLAARIELDESEFPFFLTLIMREGAKTKELKDYFDSVLLSLRERAKILYSTDVAAKCIFHNALTWEIYTLAATKDFKNDSRWISGALKQSGATSKAVEEALQLLLQKGALTFDENSKALTKNVIFNDTQEITDAYRTAFLRAASHLAKGRDAADRFDTFCMAIGGPELAQCDRVLQEAKEKIVQIVKSGQNKDRIAWFNVSLFQSSRTND